MTIDVAQQGAALCQALLLGLALGMTYDLFRILRVRIKVPLLGPLLDLLFWVVATLALFLWSQKAWDGQIRLYGAVFCLVGGGVYFWVLSRFFLWVGYRLADLATVFLEILTFPVGLLRVIFKKFRELMKNAFLSARKWYRIGQKTGGLDQAAKRRAAREKGEVDRAIQKSWVFDQAGGTGTAHLHGYLASGSSGTDSNNPEPAGHTGPAGFKPRAGKSRAGRRHRKQR